MRSFEAIAPVDGVYTLQFASGLPDAAAKPDASVVAVVPDLSEPVVIRPDAPPLPALLVGKSDPRSVSRIALAVQARQKVAIRVEVPSNLALTFAEGTQHLQVKLSLSAKDVSTSSGTTLTRSATPDFARTLWSYQGAEFGAHGPERFSRVVDGRPVTLWSCATKDKESGVERTDESLTLRLRFVPQPVTSNRVADDD
jgi:hypothetical protein